MKQQVDKRENIEKRCKHNRTDKRKTAFPFFYTNACFGKTEKDNSKKETAIKKTRKQCFPKIPTTKQKRQGSLQFPDTVLSYISLPSLTLCDPEVVVLFRFFLV
jgi:hypothetical protein